MPLLAASTKPVSALGRPLLNRPSLIVLGAPRLLLCFAGLLTLMLQARAQCDFSPSNLTFQQTFSGGPGKCSYYNINSSHSCGVSFLHSNVPNGPDSTCANQNGVPGNCPPQGNAVFCQSGGSLQCGDIIDTYGNGTEQIMVTSLAIGGPSCPSKKQVPNGIGPAGNLHKSPRHCC